jgi:HK97 gp10 family phage protein
VSSAIRTVGEKEVMERIGAVGKMLSGRNLLRAVTAGAILIEKDAKEKCPWKTGTLRRSIHTEGEIYAGDHVSVQVGTDSKPPHGYGAYVEFGTGVYGTGPGATGKPIVIVPVNKKALRWRVGGKGKGGSWAFAKRVVIQGMKARPFLRPAFDEKKDAALNEIARSGRELIEKAAKR